MQAKLTSKPTHEVIAAIQALDLESVKVRLMDPELGEGWSREYADAIEEAYRTYLSMLAKYQESAESIMLSKDVDEFWHTHILQTMKYADDCNAVFGTFLHHNPHIGERTEADLAERESMAEKTRELYRREFGSAEGADAAWSGRTAANSDAAYSASSIRGRDAAYSAASIRTQGAAYSAASIRVGSAAYSAAAIQSDRAAYSAASIRSGQAAYSAASISVGKAAYSAASIRADRAAYSAATISSDKAAYSAASIDADRAAYSAASISAANGAYSAATLEH